MAENSLQSFHLIQAQSMATTVTSAPQPCQFQDNIGIQFIWTGTPTGTFSVNVSINYNPVTPATATWTPLTLSSSPAASGAAGNYFVSLQGLPVPYYQVVYTPASGTGTLDVWVSAKGV